MIVDWKHYGTWEAVGADLPGYLQGQWCVCTGGIKTKELTSDAGKILCGTCGKPPLALFVKYLEECYDCERWYLPSVYPDKFKLCQRCD